jgi:large subunit ribosomal protein L29
MAISKFTLLESLSNKEITEAIAETRKELFSLKFKKATRQTFKPNKIKITKCRLAQLKTLLSLRLNSIEKNN